MNEMTDEYKQEKVIENDDGAFLQLRQDAGGNMLHLQGFGTKANRDYGFAQRFAVPMEVAEAVRNYSDVKYPSLASDQKIYFRKVIELYRYHDGIQIHIHIPSEDNNKGDSFVLDLSSPVCINLIEWADENNLITNVKKKGKFTGGN